MKIAVFFKGFEPAFESKEHAQIVLGLRDTGMDSMLYTLDKPALRGCNLSVPLTLMSQKDAADVDYWRFTPYDAIIVYTRLDRSNLWMVNTLKKAGKTVIVKADTDGRKTFPVYPRDLLDYTYNTVAEKAKAFYLRVIRRVKGRVRADRLIDHINRADGIIVESPQAFANFAYILSYWGAPELIKKVFVIPNPASDHFTTHPIPVKDNLIVASGGWDSRIGNSYIKNTVVMVNALCRFLIARLDYKAVVIGSGGDTVEKIAAKWAPHKNLQIAGYVPNDKAAEYVGKAKIIFQPSLYETFGIAVAEGLCMGCSFVGSPLDSFEFLAAGGSSGTLAPDFTEEAFLGTLLADSIKWERNIYSADAISSTWRPLLNRRAVVEQYLQIVDKLG
jgi:glycosyltransferase involved in cell wall biosynthesis